jgi:hypothetical protein
MKKVLSLIAVAALTATFVACGPSKEELEAAEKAKADSIAAVALADSLANAAKADSIAAVEKAAADSLAAAAKADSIAKAEAEAKGGKKKK